MSSSSSTQQILKLRKVSDIIPEPTMQPKLNNITMCYNYSNREKEYVFAYRGRPFAVLDSSNFPTPASSYIDHHLVLELGLKMKDVQCKKISFCGKKAQIVGKSILHCAMRDQWLFLGKF